MLYREVRQRASGDGARRGRLTGFLAEVSRQAVWYGSRQSVGLGGRVCSRWAEARAGGRSVSRDEEYLTNSRSAGLGCASWLEEEDEDEDEGYLQARI